MVLQTTAEVTKHEKQKANKSHYDLAEYENLIMFLTPDNIWN